MSGCHDAVPSPGRPATLDHAYFRRVLGNYPTGVCAITAMHNGAPVAMIVGSFTSVSLDPPLVAFFADRRSTSWSKIEAAGRFCVNVLADNQEDVSRTLSRRVIDKFVRMPHRLSASGLPIIDGVIAWIECNLHAVHEAGDHFIALGQVHSLEVERPQGPLLFCQGGYGRFETLMAASR